VWRGAECQGRCSAAGAAAGAWVGQAASRSRGRRSAMGAAAVHEGRAGGTVSEPPQRRGCGSGAFRRRRGVRTAAAPWAQQRFIWAGQAGRCRPPQRRWRGGGARAGRAAQQRGVGAAAARRGAARALAQVAGQAERRREAGAAAARSVVADTLRIRSGGESAVGRVRTLAL